MSKSFFANFGGICFNCLTAIEPGQTVHYEGSHLVHTSCPDPLAHGEVCQTCWLTKPCDCA